MDKDTRGAIYTATQEARTILEGDFSEQLQGDYDVMPDGRFATNPGVHLAAAQRTLRARIVAAIEHKRGQGLTPKEAVADYLRDAAFTTLNRFVALKMLEARDLVRECVSKGDASSGFAEFCGFAPSLRTPDGSGYRLYVESIFDELSTEVKVLFDRRDPAAALWPRKAAFDSLLATLNVVDLKSVWREDETIGWVYQYFNSGDERKFLRKASSAPRNTRELAIRNQFFTPSYVVRFLSDNTLGRIWYDMHKGNTQIKHICEYLLIQPNEIFVEGEKTLDLEDVAFDDLPRGEKWNNPVHIPFRPKKDPRDLRVIDPACGSGHFLLYCFGLFFTVYEEAWNDPESPASEMSGKSLREDFPDAGHFKESVPELILRHNLHGVDIDPRCAQIAQLALWMRAQRAYQETGIARTMRPKIRRSNIVVAEPMPGDKQIVEQFASTLQPPILGDFFKEIVEEMKLAGEMGTLLPIERKLASMISRARLAYVEQQRSGSRCFLPGLAPPSVQGELDFSGVDDERFFEQAEERIVQALTAFVGDALNGVGARRRLFAEDSQQGIAFVELSRRKFDVALMNPPFGAGSQKAKSEFDKAYPITRNDVLTAFIERAIRTSTKRGRIGAITSRTPLFLSSYRKWREEIVTKLAPPVVIVDLGVGVLDGAMVETAAYVLETKLP